MEKYMDREGRALDIACFLHRNYMMSRRWVTVGEYARYAGISASPHLRGLFAELLDLCVVTVREEPYKKTVKYTFALNYDHVSEFYTQLKQQIVNKVGTWQEKLL